MKITSVIVFNYMKLQISFLFDDLTDNVKIVVELCKIKLVWKGDIL